MATYLVVANLTLCGRHVIDTLQQRLSEPGDHAVRVLVPAVAAPGSGWSHSHESDRAAAHQRLDIAMRRLSGLGVPVTGEIGDALPVEATLDALRDHPDIDEVIVSTLPPNASRWLRLDTVSRISRATNVPVTHIVSAHEEALV